MDSSLDGAGDADALAALRHATASRHAELDSGLPLSSDNATLSDYHAHLTLLQNWLGPLQGWLDSFCDGPQGPAGLAPTDRLALIAADLAEPSLAQVRGPDLHARPHGWPVDASPAFRWGVCYVIEGSHLGGAVLYQRLHERLAPHPLRYLRGAPGGPGPRWRAFMQAVRANVRTPVEVADACAGARDAFDAILAQAFPKAG